MRCNSKGPEAAPVHNLPRLTEARIDLLRGDVDFAYISGRTAGMSAEWRRVRQESDEPDWMSSMMS